MTELGIELQNDPGTPQVPSVWDVFLYAEDAFLDEGSGVTMDVDHPEVATVDASEGVVGSFINSSRHFQKNPCATGLASARQQLT